MLLAAGLPLAAAWHGASRPLSPFGEAWVRRAVRARWPSLGPQLLALLRAWWRLRPALLAALTPRW